MNGNKTKQNSHFALSNEANGAVEPREYACNLFKRALNAVTAADQLRTAADQLCNGRCNEVSVSPCALSEVLVVLWHRCFAKLLIKQFPPAWQQVKFVNATANKVSVTARALCDVLVVLWRCCFAKLLNKHFPPARQQIKFANATATALKVTSLEK